MVGPNAAIAASHLTFKVHCRQSRRTIVLDHDALFQFHHGRCRREGHKTTAQVASPTLGHKERLVNGGRNVAVA